MNKNESYENYNNELIQVMRLQFNKAILELDASTLPSEISEIYETYILKIILHSLIESIDSIKYLLFGGYIISDIYSKNIALTFNIIGKEIYNIYFLEGSSFISDKEVILNKLLPLLLFLFQRIVEYQTSIKFTNFNHKVYKALLTIFVQFSNNLCLHSSFQFLK